MKIKKWIISGQLEDDSKTTEEVLDNAGDLMDDSCSHEILGENLFLGEDGNYYQVTVEAVINKISKKYAKEIIAESEEGLAS